MTVLKKYVIVKKINSFIGFDKDKSIKFKKTLAVFSS